MRVNNRTIGIALAAVIFAMIGVSFAAIPLYRVFCSVTGYAGTPQIGPQAAPGATRQIMTVRFNANVNPNLPWDFAPQQDAVRVPLGQDQLAYYTATNLAGMLQLLQNFALMQAQQNPDLAAFAKSISVTAQGTQVNFSCTSGQAPQKAGYDDHHHR